MHVQREIRTFSEKYARSARNTHVQREIRTLTHIQQKRGSL
ncbi:hypothetical protein [Planococcus shixiaomingii]|nr:hypothetical protein [Planococcus sp. N028]